MVVVLVSGLAVLGVDEDIATLVDVVPSLVFSLLSEVAFGFDPAVTVVVFVKLLLGPMVVAAVSSNWAASVKLPLSDMLKK